MRLYAFVERKRLVDSDIAASIQLNSDTVKPIHPYYLH